ncbi:hypothetical protein [Spodoptera cosmioides nucleopolyhedrovirus]|uniref:RING-type domain-containing protein n=1 Tax=Spodoptera cosmioides nucleopolyhedrovirus TaxID=2605774 RepID=A0A6B7KMJ6_9ABAC|nr:hypothetical protein [Spodoptera cosmioides nucleopolyhedrovirus]
MFKLLCRRKYWHIRGRDTMYLSLGLDVTNGLDYPPRLRHRFLSYRRPSASEKEITLDELADMSKLSIKRMRVFLKKNTNIVGVDQYSAERLKQVLPRAVREAQAKKRCRFDQEFLEARRKFAIDVNRKLIDCSRTRSHAIAMFKKRNKSTMASSSKVVKPDTNCHVCKKHIESWKSVTFETCGHSVVCTSCDEASSESKDERKCPLCQQVVNYTYVFKPCVSLLPGF